MSELLTNNLCLVTSAPNGVGKLRQLILQLAVMGKLVPQDPNDEPASELLKRISKHRDELIADGLLRTNASEVKDADKYINLPSDGWAYEKLGCLARFIDYRGKTPTKVSTGITLITAKNVRFGYLSKTPHEYITEAEYSVWMTRGFPSNGDLLFTTEAPLGNVAIVDLEERFALAQRVICLQPHVRALNQFMRLALMSVPVRRAIEIAATGMTATGIKASRLKEIAIPVPPLAEQHRIVAKVDELMALCDRLEAQQNDAEAAHKLLVKELLNALIKDANQSDFATRWQRVKDNFDTLFTTEESVDVLKETILQLAVMGKLVPQDPNDEPASELLKRILAERHSKLTEKTSNKTPSQRTEQAEFLIPQIWSWANLRKLVLRSDSGWSPTCEGRRRNQHEWGVLKVSAVSWGRFNSEENKALPNNLSPREECEVKNGDFLISRANTAELIARSVIVENYPGRLMMSDKIVRLVFSNRINSYYVNIWNTSKFARRYYESVAGGTSSSMKNVSREQILELAIPLPPLAEQHRIVAKVDELMALCDLLKEKIRSAQSLQDTLSSCLIDQSIPCRNVGDELNDKEKVLAPL